MTEKPLAMLDRTFGAWAKARAVDTFEIFKRRAPLAYTTLYAVYTKHTGALRGFWLVSGLYPTPVRREVGVFYTPILST